MVASTISGRPWRTSPIQGWARRSRSGPQPIHGQKGYPAPAFFAPLTSTIVTRKSTGSATFTRATTAYVEDFEGILRPVLSGEVRFTGARRVYNQVQTSAVQDDGVGGWLPYGGAGSYTVTTGISDPVGGTAAVSVDPQATGGAQVQTSGGGNWAEGASAVASVWMRVTSGTLSVTIYPQGTDATGGATVTVNTTWQRFTTTAASVGGKLHRFIINWSTTVLQIYGVQNENVVGASVTAPSEYVSVGVLSAPYHGANVDGVRYFRYQNGNSVASNVVTEATGAAIADATLKGYLAEGARTNRCLQSQEFDEAVWVSGGGGIAVDDQAHAAPDGTTTADTLTASGANGTLIQDLGVVASAAKTFSVYLKRKTGTGNIDLTMDGGATWTTVAVTSSWARYSMTQTLADEDVGIRIVTSGDEVYAWGAQVETASFASSYIPTTTIAVARNADVLTYPAGNIADAAGTAFAEISSLWANTDGIASVITTTSGGRVLYRDPTGASSSMGFYDGAAGSASDVGATYQNSVAKVASLWGRAGKSAAFLRGAIGSTQGAYDGTIAAGSFGVGCTAAGTGQWNGTIKNVRIWTTALSDAQIAAI